jgi:hypothetical protein
MDADQLATLKDKRLRLEHRRNQIGRGLTSRADGWQALRQVCEEIESLNRQIEAEAPGLKQSLANKDRQPSFR